VNTRCLWTEEKWQEQQRIIEDFEAKAAEVEKESLNSDTLESENY